MHIMSLREAAALTGKNTEALRRMIYTGQLACLRSEGERAPIYVTSEALRAAGFELPETIDVGDPSIETLIREVIDARLGELLAANEALAREVEDLRQRLCTVERLHAYRPLSTHTFPEGYEPWN